MLIYTPFASTHCKFLFKVSVGFILSFIFPLLSITLLQDFLSSHADQGRTLLTDLSDSSLSLLKAILLIITLLTSLKHYFVYIITFLEIFRQVPASTLLHQHSPTYCLIQMIFDLSQTDHIHSLCLSLLMVFTYAPHLR